MSASVPRHVARRTIYVSPRLQWGTGLLIAALVAAAGALFGWSFHRAAAGALRAASLQAHYEFASAYAVVGPALLRYAIALFAVAAAASAVAFLVLIHRVRRGAGRLIEVFRISRDGDLSTPADAAGIEEIASLGKRIDATRSELLSLLGGIREEAELLRNEPLPPGEFRRRWDALKEKIARVAP